MFFAQIIGGVLISDTFSVFNLFTRKWEINARYNELISIPELNRFIDASQFILTTQACF